MPGLSSADWGSRLADHFFRPEYAGTYVLFYVDRPLLAQLAGTSEEEAVEDLVSSLMPQLRRLEPAKLFDPLLKETVRWKLDGGEGPPPCLAALALAVLAASEMRREADRPSSNYHAWFLELMQLSMPDLGGESLWDAYADTYPALWRNLEWWLDERHRGRLGQSTIAEDSRNTKLGYADSQTIFRSSDREKLSQFFSWIGLRSADELAAGELLQYFRLWAARRDDLSPGAQLMIAERGTEQLQLGELILEAASRWEGGVRDDQGRSEGRLALTLTRPPRMTLGLAAPCPEGFPPRLRVEHRGQALVLEASGLDQPLADDEQHWYDGLELAPTEPILREGLRLRADGYVLRLPAHRFHVLHMSPEHGCWASVEHLRPSQPAWILAADEEVDQVRELLERRARPEWCVVRREGIAPPGWTLIRDVVIDPVPVVEPERLERLAPRLSNRLLLNGGLPLPRGSGVYLSGGDPDVMLPPLSEDIAPPPVDLDGVEVAIEAGESLVSLADLAPPEGTHTVRIGTISRDYSTVRTLRNASPQPETPVGHELRVRGAGLRPTSLDASGAPECHPDGVRVLGSLVEVGASVAMGQPGPLLFLPRGARRRLLIGAQPGVLEAVDVPPEPPWMRSAGLQCQYFEHSPRIDAHWLVTEWSTRGLQVRRIDVAASSTSAAAGEDPQAWRQAVLACDLDSVDDGDREAWVELRARAAALG